MASDRPHSWVIKEYAASTKQMSQMGRLDMKRSRSLDSVEVTEEEK